MKKSNLLIAVAVLAVVQLANGCGAEEEAETTAAGEATVPAATAGAFTLASTSFGDGEEIPDKHACEDEGGANTSPQLSWSGAPEGTASYAIVMDDETPPCGRGDDACMHWSVFNIPVDVSSLGEGEDMAAIPGVALGRNYTGGNGYAGPCPPEPHVYKITIYALDGAAPLLKSGEAYTRSGFEAEFARYILGSETLEGSFTP